MNRLWQHSVEPMTAKVFDSLDRDDVAVAFSVRRLFESYTGSLVTVRRDSDNAERDFSFDYTGVLNVPALEQWVADVDPDGDAFVTRWYDQGINNNHAIQPSLNLQPQIVRNGAVITDGSKPMLEFLSQEGFLYRMMRIEPFSALNAINQSVSTFAVHRRRSTVPAEYSVIFDARNTARGDMFTAPYHAYNPPGGENKYFVNVNRRANWVTAHLVTEYTLPYPLTLTSYVFTGVQGRTYIDGEPINNWTNQQLVAAPEFLEAAIGGVSDGDFFGGLCSGEISEVIVYSADKTPVRTVIEANINKAYNL